MLKKKEKNKKLIARKIFKYLSTVGFGVLSATLMIPASVALEPIEASGSIIASEGGKAAINEALKIAKSKPALSIAAAISCLACLPVAGVVVSPAVCIACGILISKVLG